MALSLRVAYRPGSQTLIRSDLKGHETHARTRGRLFAGIRRGVAWLRQTYGLDFAVEFVPPTASPRPQIITVGRSELYIGGGYYGTGMHKNGIIWFMSFLTKDPFADPQVIARIFLHEYMHVRRVRYRGDKYGHATDRRDLFHAWCGSELTESLAWWRAACGIIPGWKPPRAQKLLAGPEFAGGCKGVRA
jgi:hypothetical protein